MNEHPILFNGAMVRAILDGTKTQTRRVAKLNASGRVQYKGKNYHTQDSNAVLACPLGKVGDLLWVRETFAQGWDVDPVTDCLMQFDDDGNELPKKTWYRATDSHIHWSDDDGWEANVPWKPSIHMPRWASRIDLEITNVRIERVQSITEEDALSEGLVQSTEHSAKFAFNFLWDSIYNNYRSNPWVWCVEFKRVEK